MKTYELCVLHDYLNDPKNFFSRTKTHPNPGYAIRILNKYLPTDTGIELEVGAKIINKLSGRIRKMFVRDSSFELTLRVRSIQGYLKLYELLREISSFDELPSSAGIHFHTNIKSKLNFSKIDKIISKCNQLDLCTKLARIFNYTGSYNELLADTHKGYFLNVRRDFNTLEYRGIPFTMSFRTLMTQVMICHLCTEFLVTDDKDWTHEMLMMDIRQLASLRHRRRTRIS